MPLMAEIGDYYEIISQCYAMLDLDFDWIIMIISLVVISSCAEVDCAITFNSIHISDVTR